MTKKEYEHLVKPLTVQKGPVGLYPEPRIWMDGKDMEGFNAHFTYGFVKEPGVFHPIEGMVVHPYDECLIFAGYQDGNILRMDAEISIQLGEEGEEHVPQTLGRPYSEGIAPWPGNRPVGRQADRPLRLRTERRIQGNGVAGKAEDHGTKHAHLIKRLITVVEPAADGSGMGYERVIDENGILRPSERGIGPGNGDQIVWLFGNNLEGMDVNFTWGLYSKCGKWHRKGEAHTHPEEEVLVFVGLDPDNMDYLGAELEFALGKEYERHIYNKPTAVVAPRVFPTFPSLPGGPTNPTASSCCV